MTEAEQQTNLYIDNIVEDIALQRPWLRGDLIVLEIDGAKWVTAIPIESDIDLL